MARYSHILLPPKIVTIIHQDPLIFHNAWPLRRRDLERQPSNLRISKICIAKDDYVVPQASALFGRAGS